MTNLEPDKYYHIFNRANGNEQIFHNEENYNFFLRKYQFYINPIADTLCYCLMPNHFHFVIKIKDEGSLSKIKKTEIDNSHFCSKQFSNLFSSYTQAFNKQHSRKGSLFMKNFKRKHVDTQKYLYQLIHYIHYNPIEAGIADNLSSWKFSSYNSIISDKPTLVKREEVLQLYENRGNFIYTHAQFPKGNF